MPITLISATHRSRVGLASRLRDLFHAGTSGLLGRPTWAWAWSEALTKELLSGYSPHHIGSSPPPGMSCLRSSISPVADLSYRICYHCARSRPSTTIRKLRRVTLTCMHCHQPQNDMCKLSEKRVGGLKLRTWQIVCLTWVCTVCTVCTSIRLVSR